MKAAEFFAGMGLVRAGLNRCGIETVFANDMDMTKAALYRDNWGVSDLCVADIKEVSGVDVPTVDLATASFPCVDLSVAGLRKGLNGTRSGVIFEFFRILDEMDKRAPSTVMIENVPGFLTANDGQDWHAVMNCLEDLGYVAEYIAIDAAAFVPQSRLRVFIIGSRKKRRALPPPPTPYNGWRLAEIVDEHGEWWPPHQLGAFLTSLSSLQSARVADYQMRRRISYFGAFRRTRNGAAVWEVRADEKAGALRTTRGGSARQAVLRAGRGGLAARWMNVKEYSRLQGAEDLLYDSVSPRQAMFALGDAVCVPVIEWLTRNCLLPLMAR